MRHFSKVNDHWLTTDVVAKRHAKRRARFVEFGRRQHLTQLDDFAFLIWDFDTDNRFTRNNLNYAHRNDSK